jgi:excisionase family DNA binding protein
MVREEATTTRHTDSLPLLLTVPRAAKLLGISRSAAYRLAASGELPSRRLGGRVYIVTKELSDLVEAST